MIPTIHPLHRYFGRGFFDDEAIISALSRLSADPMVPVIMTMAVLYIWTTLGGEKPPTALDIAMFFEDRNEWISAVEKNWSRIGLGLPLSTQLLEVAEAFHVVCARRLACVGPTLAFNNASRALRPEDALKQTRLRHLAWATTTANRNPIEITSRGNPRDRPPGAVPSKMKPDLLGFTEQEAFMLQVAIEAESLSSHQPLLLHQAGKGYSEHFETIWRNMMGNLQPSALEYCCLAWRRWRAHTKSSPAQWDGLTLAQALFSPVRRGNGTLHRCQDWGVLSVGS